MHKQDKKNDHGHFLHWGHELHNLRLSIESEAQDTNTLYKYRAHGLNNLRLITKSEPQKHQKVRNDRGHFHFLDSDHNMLRISVSNHSGPGQRRRTQQKTNIGCIVRHFSNAAGAPPHLHIHNQVA